MKSKTLKTLALALALAGAMTLSAQAASTGGAKVNASDVNFRAGADTGSRAYATLQKGTLVVVGEKVNDNWYKAVYRGTVGYINATYLDYSENLDGDFGKGTINGTDVRLRSAPGLTASVIATYDDGTQMTVLGVYGNWYKVSCGSVTGFVHSDFFALNGGVAEYSRSGSASGQTIVDTAMKYLDTPYVWAGTSPRGFDCSGFVYYVYNECGYTINRTAASIYQNGVYVEKSDLQVGDAVCFASSSNSIGHVGIYIGDGQFIHSSSGSGKVIISDLDTDYYVRNYVGARRIV